MSTHDAFALGWEEEQDWLVEVVMLPKNEKPEELEADLEFIGKLFAYSMATNTRMLAQVGDPEMPGYELWFSFDSEEHKQTFLHMVRDDGYADPDDEGEFVPPGPECMSDLKNLRPLGVVFPKEQADRIAAYAGFTATALGIDIHRVN